MGGGGNWILEIYRVGDGGDRIATLEFATLPSLRIVLTVNRGKNFFVTIPGDATPEDRNTLLELPRL